MIASVAFILSYLGWGTALVLIVGYVIVVEKKQWFSKETIKALYLAVAYSLIMSIINLAFRLLYNTLGNIHFIYNLLNTTEHLLSGILHIGMLIICILAVLKVIKGEDTVIPFIDDLVNQSLGIIKNLNR